MIERESKKNFTIQNKLEIGDYVLMKCEKRSQNRSNKLMQLNFGPLKVIKITEHLAYLKEDGKRAIKTGVSLSQLVKYQQIGNTWENNGQGNLLDSIKDFTVNKKNSDTPKSTNN